MIDIKNFHSNLLKTDKSHIKTFIFTILVTSQLISLVILRIFNLLYLIIKSARGYFKEKNSEKYLILDSTEKYKFFLELYQKLKHLIMEKNCFMKKIMLELGLILTMIYL